MFFCNLERRTQNQTNVILRWKSEYICWFDYKWYLSFFSCRKVLGERCRGVTIPNISRSSYSEVFFWKGVLKICTKFTEEHPCRSATSINWNWIIEITLQHGHSPVNLLYIFITGFLKTTSEWLLPYKQLRGKA